MGVVNWQQQFEKLCNRDGAGEVYGDDDDDQNEVTDDDDGYEHESDDREKDNIENDIKGAEGLAVEEEQKGEKPWSEGMR